MSDRIAVTLLILAATAVSALAGPANGVTGSLPEPASIGLLGLGIGGAYLAKRFYKRK